MIDSKQGGFIDYIDPDKEIGGWIQSFLGIWRYAQIMRSVWNTKVDEDRDFQILFDGFYKVRRNESWRKTYYHIFESMKHEKADFREILLRLHQCTGQVEASFASKMLATLDSTQPIWDQYVLKNLGLPEPKRNIDIALDNYERMTEWYRHFVKSENGLNCIEKFDLMLPDYAWISDVKKIDYFLWGLR